MAYSEALANRIRGVMGNRRISERKMFGGLCFLLQGKMCCGVLKDLLVVRIDPANSAALLKSPHVRPMDFTGRPMRGFLYVGPGACKTKKQLAG